jgi:hypothetical protein
MASSMSIWLVTVFIDRHYASLDSTKGRALCVSIASFGAGEQLLVFSHIACSTNTRARSSNSQNRGSDVSSGSTCSYRHRHQNPPTQVYHHHTTLFLTFVDATVTSYQPPSKDSDMIALVMDFQSASSQSRESCPFIARWAPRGRRDRRTASQQLLFIKVDTTNDLHAVVSTVHLKLSHIVSTSSRLELFETTESL